MKGCYIVKYFLGTFSILFYLTETFCNVSSMSEAKSNYIQVYCDTYIRKWQQSRLQKNIPVLTVVYATLILSFIISFVVFSICQHKVISILTTPENLNTKNIIRYSLTNTCLSCCPKHRSIQISSFVMYCSKYYLIFEKNFSHLFYYFFTPQRYLSSLTFLQVYVN